MSAGGAYGPGGRWRWRIGGVEAADGEAAAAASGPAQTRPAGRAADLRPLGQRVWRLVPFDLPRESVTMVTHSKCVVAERWFWIRWFWTRLWACGSSWPATGRVIWASCRSWSRKSPPVGPWTGASTCFEDLVGDRDPFSSLLPLRKPSNQNAAGSLTRADSRKSFTGPK